MTGNHPRIPCCIPFCRRGTRKWPDASQIICGPHWRVVPLRYRKHKAATERRCRRVWEELRAAQSRWDDEAAERGSPSSVAIQKHAEAWSRLNKCRAMADRAWERCKRIAVERAGGIG